MPPKPDCQQLLITNPGPGLAELCQAEAEMRAGEPISADVDERRRRLTTAAAGFERASGSLRDPELKIYAIETLARLYDATHLDGPREVEQALRALVALMPGNSSPLRRLAKIQEDQGFIDAAENTLLMAKQQAAEDIEVYRALSQFYARRAMQISTANAQAERVTDPAPPPPPGEPDAEGYFRIGGDVPAPKVMSKSVPLRPRDAEAAGLSGIVILEIRIDENGTVTDAKLLRSIPMLDDAAVATVKQWRYAPTIVDGRPVPVKMTVTVNFAPPK